MAESFCIVKQGRGRGGLFKWFSKAEFSLCDAPGVAGGRPCASLLLNMSSALHKMLHRAQISLLLCCFFGVCNVHTHICQPRHSITGEPWTAKLLTDRAFHIDHTDLWGRWCTSHLFKSLGWFLFLLPGLTRTLIVIPVHKSFGGCLIHRSRKQWTWHDTFSYSQTSIITNCALQGCGWPGRPARGRMVVQVFCVLLRN